LIQLNDGTILAASGKYILTLETGENDWDIVNDCYKAIHWKGHTKGYSLESPFNQKKISKILFAANQRASGLSKTDIDVMCDYASVNKDDISLDDSFVWGDVWGESWGWVDLITKEIKVSLRGNRVSLVFEKNTINEAATIYGIAFIFKRKKPKGVKVI
jgi:hypothetical protein